MSTRHPQIPEWIGGKPRVLLINRKDMVGEADRAAWSRFFAERGHATQWTNGNQGDGVGKVGRGGARGGWGGMECCECSRLWGIRAAIEAG